MSSIPPSDNSPVVAYYDAGFEETRLDQGIAQLEAVRTRQLLARFLPPAPATLHGVEGPACLLPDFERRWRDPAQRRTMTWLAETFGSEPSLLGVSAHLLVVAFAPAR